MRTDVILVVLVIGGMLFLAGCDDSRSLDVSQSTNGNPPSVSQADSQPPAADVSEPTSVESKSTTDEATPALESPILEADPQPSADNVSQPTGDELKSTIDDLPRDFTNGIGMKFKLIPAGEFMMGSPEEEENRDSDEKQHRVRITKPFYLGIYEVTQEQYDRVMGESLSKYGGATLPVAYITWDEAMEFCRELSDLEGRTYRLPTEAEWEYACRAGTTTPFSFGSALNGKEANCDGSEPYGTSIKGPDRGDTVPVGSYQPNNFGLYDMHGNVSEWCLDRYKSSYYANSPVDDPDGPSTGSFRVFRGGGWLFGPESCRSATRGGFDPGVRGRFLGFRAVLVSTEETADTESKSSAGEVSPSLARSDPENVLQPLPDDASKPAGDELELTIGDLPQDFTNRIGMKFKLIPAGEFIMGSPEEEENRDPDEKQHRVRITKPFYMGIYEVTVGDFQKFVEATGYKTDAETDGGENDGGESEEIHDASDSEGTWRNVDWQQTESHPVVNVSWNDAIAFCNWLRKTEGRRYRLPTDAQWEYACRAGTTTTYYNGNDPEKLVEVGNVADGTLLEKLDLDLQWEIHAKDGYVYTAPVGQFKPNKFGLYDMQGNVSEWCMEWYDEEYFSNSPVDDPVGPLTGSYRILRGGNWFVGRPWHCRSANRRMCWPEIPSDGYGFRVVLVLTE